MPLRREAVYPAYALVRGLGRFWVWFLFRQVDVQHAEQVPETGPALLCMNHPNNLIDSLLIASVLPRQVHYLATAALFRHAILSRLLSACGAIPVHRRQGEQDDAGRETRNAAMFSACLEALGHGRVLGIYPEGTTHAEARVQPIRTGAARIALAYEAQRAQSGDGDPLSIVPVGLTFEARRSFRGRVRIAFGEPIPVAGHLGRYRADPSGAVDALTREIQLGMEIQVVHVSERDAAALVSAIEELYRTDLARALERQLAPREVDIFRLSRTIVDAVNHFSLHDPRRVEGLRQRIEGYQATLTYHRLRDRMVRPPLPGGGPRPFRSSALAVAAFPFFIYGTAVNALPYLVPRVLSRRMARKETDYATWRLLSSVVAFPLFWGLETWLVWAVAGPRWVPAFLVSLPMSGLVAYHYLRGLGVAGGRLRFWLFARTRTREAERLVTERAAILAELDRARADYLATARGQPR